MKKLMAACAVVAALGCVSTTIANAQTIGFKVGPTFSKFNLDPADNANETLTSFGGGGFVRFGAAGLSLQLEALAITKGSKTTDPNDATNNGKLKLTYIEVPLTAMFKLGNGPYVFVGPSVGFEASCKVSAELQGTSFSANCDDNDPNAPENFPRKKVDFGVTGGAGIQFPAGPGSVLVEGRYTHGLTNIDDSGTDTQKIRNRSFAVFGGYAISIGSR